MLLMELSGTNLFDMGINKWQTDANLYIIINLYK